jgi:hypothetical protein
MEEKNANTGSALIEQKEDNVSLFFIDRPKHQVSKCIQIL